MRHLINNTLSRARSPPAHISGRNNTKTAAKRTTARSQQRNIPSRSQRRMRITKLPVVFQGKQIPCRKRQGNNINNTLLRVADNKNISTSAKKLISSSRKRKSSNLLSILNTDYLNIRKL